MGPIGFCFHKYHHIYGKNVIFSSPTLTIFFCSLSSFLNSYRSCKIVNTELSTSFCQQRFDNFFMAQLAGIKTNIRSKYVCFLSSSSRGGSVVERGGTGILNNDIQKEGFDFHNGSLRRKEYSRYAR